MPADELASLIESRLDRQMFQDHHWSGTFWEYLGICEQNPGVARNAFQRLYDAIMAQGWEVCGTWGRYHGTSQRSSAPHPIAGRFSSRPDQGLVKW